jgi:cytochrome c peroxidase
MKGSRAVAVTVVVLGLLAVGVWVSLQPEQEAMPAAIPIGSPVEIAAPLGLPPVPIPADNPPTAETIALGRRLYYDPVLSIDNTVSCASCHHPDFGFSDGERVSEGVEGKTGTRNSPTVFNSAYFTTQFERLRADASYREAFRKAFGSEEITYEMVEKAIASFERTVVSGNSPFDRYFYGGEEDALSESAKRGLEVFRNPEKGNCAVCHTIEENYALFTDNKFHNLGVGVNTKGEFEDVGRLEVTQSEADKGAFKTPSLRNVALTAPYLHDGSLNTLKDAVDFYIGGGNSNPHLDEEIHALDFLTGQEREDLLEFLNSLTGEMPADVGPPAGTETEKVAEQARR